MPPSFEECETCREVDCTEERWEQCERRLTAEAASFAVSGPGQTDEMLPRVLEALPAALPAPADEPAETERRERKISGD